MSLNELTHWMGYIEIVLCVAALCFLLARGKGRENWALGTFLAVRAASSLIFVFLGKFPAGHIDMRTRYRLYFYVYWLSFAVESLLVLLIIYGIVRTTTRPWNGLRRVGSIVLCVVAAFVVGIAFLAEFSTHVNGVVWMTHSIALLQRGQSLVSLCMVLVVLFAIRSLGLSYRSTVVGVSLGLGLMAIDDLTQSACLTLNPDNSALFNLVNALVLLATLILWTAYLAMREPHRRTISPNSPVWRWNERTLAWFG